MQYENYRNKIMRRAAALRRVIHFSPVITAAIIVFAAVFTVLAIAAGTVTDVSFANSAAYGSAPVHSASAFLSKSSFEYRLKGESEWSSEAPKMPGAYDVRVVTSGFFGTRYKNLDTFHVYPRRVSVTADAETIKYGETPLVKAALNHGDRIVCESFVFESNVLANTKIKANASAIKIYNAAGEDVTYAYELETPYSDITVTKREILVYVADATHQYDGKEFSYKVYEIGEGSLPEGERLQAKFEKTITDVGTVKNVPVLQIVNKYGEDVTHFYTLNEQNVGDLIVTKRPLHITTGTATYTFNGEARNCLEYTIGEGSSLVPGHEIIADGASTQTFVGTVNNTMSFTVKDADGNDVTDNYAITVTEGTITVEKCPLTITTGDGEWTYDGEKHSNREITHSELPCGTIPDDRYDIKDITDVGKIENSFTIRVMNGTSNITNNFDITYVYGTLEVTKRPIKIETPSYSWEYDGNEHMVAELVNSDTDIKCNILEGSLLDGCLIRYDFDHYQTSDTDQPKVLNVWAPAENTVPVRIFRDINDPTVNRLTTTDITKNFEITYSYGKLEVTPRPITVKPVKVTKMYDGTPLKAKELEITEGELAKDMHVMEYKLDGSRTFVTDEAVSTITEIKVISGEEDITRNYEITKEQGEIEIEPRPITIKTPDYSWVYDGKEHSVAADNLGDMFVIADASQYPLPDNHKLVYVADKDTAKPSIKNVNDSPRTNDSTVRIMMGETDVTENNFIITYEYGEFEVTKRPVKIQTPSEVWMYDGKEHSVEADNLGSGFSVLDDPQYPWLENYTLVYDVNADAEKTSITYVNKDPVYNKSTILIKTGEEDVTDNFEIKYEYGTFEVTPRPIKVKPVNTTKVYDGTELKATEVAYAEGSLELVKETHSFQATISGSRTNVWDTETSVITAIEVWDRENNVYVTDNYVIDYSTEGSLTITPRPITVKPVDATKVYDGTSLSVTEVEIIGENGLAKATHSFRSTISGSRTNVLDTDDSVITDILVWDDENNEDITDNYAIDYSTKGSLTITPRSIKVKPVDDTKVYDGTPLSVTEVEIIGETAEEQLAKTTHEFRDYTISGSRTNVWDKEYSYITSITVWDKENNVDITYNYYITPKEGKLEITPRPLNIDVDSETYVFDGKEKEHRVYEMDKNPPVVSGHTVEVTKATVVIFVELDEGGNPKPIPNDLEFMVKDANGEDVTQNYAINATPGTITITPKPITVITGTPATPWVYDGEAHSYPEFTHEGIVLGTPEVDYESAVASITDVKDNKMENNTFKIKILHGEKDITDSYYIDYKYGNLTVDPRLITVKPVNATKVYDGKTLSATEVAYVEGSLELVKETQSFQATISGSRTNVWDTETSVITAIEVWDRENKVYVTDNYVIDYSTEGSLTITPRPITVKPVDAEKIFDGEPLCPDAVEIVNGSLKLVENHEFAEYTIDGELTDVGVASSLIRSESIKILDGDGVDVTKNYAIDHSTTGQLVVYNAFITITSSSAEKVYDGTSLKENGFTVKYEEGKLQDGHELKVTVTGEQIGIGSSENTFYVQVFDGEGNDVTGSYKFDNKPGKLTVSPTDKPQLHIKPVYQCKVSDGNPFIVDIKVDRDDKDNKIVITPDLRKLLAEGYTYTVEIAGKLNDNSDGAMGTISASNFRLYDSNNNNVTETYSIIYEQGTLEILPTDGKIIEVYLCELKTSEGTPLSSLLNGSNSLVMGTHYIPFNVGDVQLEMQLNYTGTDAMSLHISELNESVNPNSGNTNVYIGYTVTRNSDMQDITGYCRIKFVIFPGIDENIYTPIEIIAKKPLLE